MAKRYVRQASKDSDGDITAICDSGQPWSPRVKADAISDIDNGIHEYWVPWTTGETIIRVVTRSDGYKYLRTDRDNTTKNNLDDLPPCS